MQSIIATGKKNKNTFFSFLNFINIILKINCETDQNNIKLEYPTIQKVITLIL